MKDLLLVMKISTNQTKPTFMESCFQLNKVLLRIAVSIHNFLGHILDNVHVTSPETFTLPSLMIDAFD